MTTTHINGGARSVPNGATVVPPEAMTDLEVWPDGDPRKWWTPGEVAFVLGVPKTTVYNMRKAGQIGAVKCGRSYRVPDTELIRLSRAAADAVNPAA